MKQPLPRDTRSSVLGRVKDPDDHDSWHTFVGLYGPLIRNQAIKARLTEDESQEVTQETLIEISQRIQHFEYDRRKGSFKAWLCQLTRWRIANQIHKRQHGIVSMECLILDSDDSNAHVEQLPVLTGDPDEAWEREWRKALFNAALSKLRHELPPKQFQVLDYLMVKEWSVALVAETLGTNRAHIYLLKFRVIAALRREIKRLENQRI